MYFFSKKINKLYKLTPPIDQLYRPKIEVESKLNCITELKIHEWKEVAKLNDKFSMLYCKLRYGSKKTYILRAYIHGVLAHIQWVVPGFKIIKRFPFVKSDQYAIITCLTKEEFRGYGIYPSQLQTVANSSISSNGYWIWTTSDNIPSIKGIEKAGAEKVGCFTQCKYLCGLVSFIIM